MATRTRNADLIDRLEASKKFTDEQIAEWRALDYYNYSGGVDALVRKLRRTTDKVGDLTKVMCCRRENHHQCQPVLSETPKMAVVGYRHTSSCVRCKTLQFKTLDSNDRPQGYDYKDSPAYALVKERFDQGEAATLVVILEWEARLAFYEEQLAPDAVVRQIPVRKAS